MAIYCELGTGQRLYLENQGDRTIVTLSSSGAGQQQQATIGLTTGVWTGEPQIYQTPDGIIATIPTATGSNSIQIQGSSAQLLRETPTLENATRLRSSQTEEPPAGFSMPPMPPLKMGNMTMSFQPMEMRIGNMAMSTGNSGAEKRNFCSQCGTKLSEGDRFCSHCGHPL